MENKKLAYMQTRCLY